ncbi:MAG: BlaI/MecI/CopY family transcriptional regulator [Lachnospiraceae bacterium]|nr:BlaI/MecI/CopY family transcriptional regulator [Lachnospiraceae bacterium]
METKLFDSELTIMSIIWEEGDITAKEIAEIAKKRVNWSKTTTYTVIKKCIEKGAIERSDPNYICHALISKEEVQQFETEELIDKVYDGRTDALVAALIGQGKLSAKEIEHLRELVNRLK